MSDEHLIEHQVHSEELLRGHFLHAFRDTVRLPNQGLATREYVVHPGAVMPQVLAKADDKTLVAIEHYLASLKPKAASKAAAKIMHVNGARGGELFNALGCVACHAPGKDFIPAEGVPKASESTHRSVGFADLKAKYSLDSLGAFILDPLKVRADGRMPKTVMDRQDSIDIAGYLLEFQGSDGRIDQPVVSIVADKNLSIAGRKAVIAAQCAACHDLPKDAAAKPVALNKNEGGCLDADHVSGPRYALSDAQRASLKLFLAKKDESASPKLAADLTLHALNCVACHERDGKGGPDAARKPYFQGDHNLGDTGRYPPPLTGIGGKLRPEWLAKVLGCEAASLQRYASEARGVLALAWRAAAFLPFVVSPVTVAFGLLLLYPDWTASLALLLAAYALLAYPFVAKSLTAALDSLPASLSQAAATLGASAVLPNGGFVLVSQIGEVLIAPPDAASLRRLPVREAVPIAGAAQAADGALVLASLRGMRRLASLPIE